MKYLKLKHISDRREMVVMAENVVALKAVKTKAGKDAVAVLYVNGHSDFVEDTLQEIEKQLNK